jgi:hypothetical protein
VSIAAEENITSGIVISKFVGADTTIAYKFLTTEKCGVKPKKQYK